MRLTDFDMMVESGFSERARVYNVRTRAVVEEFRYELGSRPRVEAPFGKLLLRLVESRSELPPRTVLQLLDVMDVSLHVDENDLFDEAARRDVVLLGLIERALHAVEAEVGWSSPDLHDIVRTLRTRERLGWIDLGFEKRDRSSGRAARVFYEVTDDCWAVWVVVVDPSGHEAARQRVAHSEHGSLVERAFPVRSVVVKDGAFVLRDAARETLATVSLE